MFEDIPWIQGTIKGFRSYDRKKIREFVKANPGYRGIHDGEVPSERVQSWDDAIDEMNARIRFLRKTAPR